LTSPSGLPRIDIEPEDRLSATAFPEVKREQTKPAPKIQDRLVRSTKQFVSSAVNGIAPQFHPHITTEPALWKLGGNAVARQLMFAHIALPVFHLLRIIALPD
jgi:hypothetical protein